MRKVTGFDATKSSTQPLHSPLKKNGVKAVCENNGVIDPWHHCAIVGIHSLAYQAAAMTAEFPRSKQDFDLELVLDALERCHKENDILDLRHYLSAFNELSRFFKLTGRLFVFVARDISYKTGILNAHIETCIGGDYDTVQSMLDYEVENKLVRNTRVGPKHIPSGSRTLLRLHWALEFILEFLRRAQTGSDDDKMSHVAWEVYRQTLANHHPWIVRKISTLAMYWLPSRRQLIETMCKQDTDTVLELVAKVVAKGQCIYDIVERLYNERGMSHIP